MGPVYRRTDLLDGRLTFSAAARASLNESYLGRVDVGLPSLWGGRAFTDFSAVHRNVTEVAYYGPGANSEKTGAEQLPPGRHELRVAARHSSVAWSPRRRDRLVPDGQYRPGALVAIHLFGAQYGPAVAPGIDQQANFLRGGGFVEFDWRDRPSKPTSGGRYSAQYVRFLDRSSASSSFFRLDLAATQHLPLFNRTRVITVRGESSLTNASGSQRVPFYLEPTLGGGVRSRLSPVALLRSQFGARQCGTSMGVVAHS